eukprot:TRINITY_DN12855_c0_g1_i1.p1 TRINITY_DN12855_c0_g1~~TRINITY_DN12855_c0_g1_i1.p1  ORF type:complete len:622 (+),score=291.58 TRINITY_DN12855_c0_g1_i1:52-1917(+)
MAETLKCVFCGVNWEAKEKLSENLILKLPVDSTVASHEAAISKLLGVPDLSAWELCKGKGKPPTVEAGLKVSMDKLVGEMAKGKMAVFYVREKGSGKKKEKKAVSDKCKLVLCGDNWVAKAKVSENIVVGVKKSEAISTVAPEIAKALGLPSLEGWTLCKGKGNITDCKPGLKVDMGASPESLGFAAAPLIYVKKETKEEKKEEAQTCSLYQPGARVDVQNEDTEEWEAGVVINIRNDGSYDVELDSGKIEKYIEADEMRVSSKPAPKKAEAKDVSKDDQKKALMAMMQEFPSKSVPEIGGLLKGNNFDIEQTRKILKASMVEERKPTTHVDTTPEKTTVTIKIKLNDPKEAFGIDFTVIAGKVFIDHVNPGGAFDRAGVKKCHMLSLFGEEIDSADGLKAQVAELRKEEYEQFDIEVDNREEARAFVGCPCEVQVCDEWQKGVITDIYGDYECFDVKMDADGEVEEDMDWDDIRLLAIDTARPPPAQASAAAQAAAPVQSKDGPPATPPPTMPDHVGLMRKKGDDLVGLYKIRRFALYGRHLYYYSNESRKGNSKPIGVLDLTQALAMGDKTKGDNYFGIGGKSVNRVYHFLCGSKAEKEEWLGKLAEQGVRTKADCNDK